MRRLGAVNNAHMQSKTAVQNLKMTACAKKRLSEDETPTGQEVRLRSSKISTRKGENVPTE